MKQKIKKVVLAYMHFGIPSINEKMADELTNIILKIINEDKLNNE
jgi:hypothetical protein